MGDDIGTSVNSWVNVIRRARLDKTTKLVALTMASYADPDGTKVFPGLARLVVQCGIGYGTARDAVRGLRQSGLIELVHRGNRRRGQSDEYRLILAADLLERLEVPTPEQERQEIEKVKEQNVAAGRERQTLALSQTNAKEAALALSQTNANAADDGLPEGLQDQELALSQTNADEPISVGTGPTLALPPDPPPSIGPLHVNQPPFSGGDDVRTDLAVTCARVDPSENPSTAADSGPVAAKKRPHRGDQAQQAIAAAQAAMAAKRAEHAAQLATHATQ